MENLIIQSASKYSEKRKDIGQHFNVRHGWNLLSFNTLSLEKYYDRTYNYNYILLNTRDHYCEDLIGLSQPIESRLLVTDNLFERISYSLIQIYGIDKIPVNVNIAILRFNQQKDVFKKFGGNFKMKSKSGKVRYLFAILDEGTMYKLTTLFKIGNMIEINKILKNQIQGI